MENIPEAFGGDPQNLHVRNALKLGGLSPQTIKDVTERAAPPIVDMTTYDPRRLKALQRRADEARAVWVVRRDEWDELRSGLGKMEATLQQRFFVGGYQNPTAMRNEPAEYADLQQQIERTKKALARAKVEMEGARTRLPPKAQAFAAAEDFIRARTLLPCLDVRLDGPIADYPRPKLSAGEIGSFVERARGDIVALGAKRKDTECRSVPKDVAIARLDAELGAIVSAWERGGIGSLAQPNGSARGLVVKTKTRTDSVAAVVNGELVKGRSNAVVDSFDLVDSGLYVAQNRAEIRKRYVAKIDRAYAVTGDGISDDQRASEIAAIDRALEASAVEEEAAIRLGEELGLTIDRRMDCIGAIVLGPLIVERRPLEHPSGDQRQLPTVVG